MSSPQPIHTHRSTYLLVGTIIGLMCGVTVGFGLMPLLASSLPSSALTPPPSFWLFVVGGGIVGALTTQWMRRRGKL